MISRQLASLGALAASVRVDTVDGFQGMEVDVVVASTVRSNRNGSIGFLKDERRYNTFRLQAL